MISFIKSHSSYAFLALALALVLPYQAQAAEKFKIAINDLDALGVAENIALSASDILRTELFNTGSFHVTERNQMNQIINEQKFQLSGATEQDIVKIGKLLSVQMMALGSINRLGGLIIINVRLVDIEEARVRVAESVQARGEEQLPAAITSLARKMANSIPIQGKIIAMKNRQVIVSLGQSDGVLKGSAFRVHRHGESYIDPVSKEKLGRAKLDVALLRVDDVMGDSLSSASIVDEHKTIKVGDFVTILSGNTVTGKTSSTPVFLPGNKKNVFTNNLQTTVGTQAVMGTDDESLLRSKKPGDIKLVSNRIIKSGQFPPQALAIAREVLLEGYQSNLTDRHHIDSMAWLCKLLGYSKDKQYLETLEIVTNQTENKKIRKYAKKMLRYLKR